MPHSGQRRQDQWLNEFETKPRDVERLVQAWTALGTPPNFLIDRSLGLGLQRECEHADGRSL
jgi:hypothetical protein